MKKEVIIFILMFLITFIFFSPLFFPHPSLFYTPDFGRSDIWHFNYPLKHFLSQSLKKGKLPFWSNKVGTGFPFFAEGQIGTLNFVNLILFFLFPTWLAWNLSFLIIFFTTFLGMYLFLKKNKFSCFASFWGGFIFAFGGFFVCHISHFNLIQSASFLPWLFLTTQSLLETPCKKNFLFFTFFLSQQIFSGHPQIVFISLLGLSFFALRKIFLPSLSFKNKIKIIAVFCLAIIGGLIFASPQIMPTLKLTQLSGRQKGLSENAIFNYPYPFKHLITFLFPNFFGTPKNGSYPFFGPGWGIFWENTTYLGILPIIFLIFSAFKKKKSSEEKFFWFLLIFSLLLVLGENSPLYFIFVFPGFNFFRVPSRFLLLTAFSITFLATSFLNWLENRDFLKKSFRKTIFFLIFLVSLVDIFNFGFFYHPRVAVKNALSLPPITQNLDPKSRLLTHPNQFKIWNTQFDSQGWQEIEPYLYFKNGLNANLNLLFDYSQLEAFWGLPTLRQQYYQENLNRKLIDAAGIKYFISPEKIEEDQNFDLIKIIEPPNNNLNHYYLYLNRQSLPRFRFASFYIVEKNLAGFLSQVSNPNFSFKETAILEKPLSSSLEKPSLASIEIIKDEDQKIVLQTTNDKPCLLVIADSYYPEWRAKIDKKPTSILPVNLNQRAIFLLPGKHLVEIYYFPLSFWQGIIISLVGYPFVFFLFNKTIAATLTFKKSESESKL